MKNYKHLFGPVPSRRLGRSLGIDLVPFKTCSFDCIFCQLGRTTNKTVERREYVPINAVLEELNHWIEKDGVADYITLSGSGEPTLNSQFGKVIEFAQNATTIPVAVLTNGTTLNDPAVKTAAAKADVVKLSLSARDQFSFNHINRPHRKLDLKEMIKGMWSFRNSFPGELWIEVFLVWGINTVLADVSRIADLVKTLSPNRIQLNTSVRPTAEEYAFATPKKHMIELAKLFEPPAEVIPDFSSNISQFAEKNEIDVLSVLERRPCTMDQLAQILGMHKNEVSKYIGKFMRKSLIRSLSKENNVYYIGIPGKEIDHANV